MLCRCLFVALVSLGLGLTGCSGKAKREMPKTKPNKNQRVPPEVSGSPDDVARKAQQRR